MVDKAHSFRSISEPPTRRKMLPSVEMSDISRRNPKVDRHGGGLEPWRSATAVQHNYVASLRSLSTSNGKKKKTLKSLENPSFRLQGSELNDVPKTVFKMENLEELVLSPNEKSCLQSKLHSLPKEVGNLRNLRQLVLDTNELEEIPRQLADLKHLDTLTLSNNHLSDLPDGFSGLGNLRSLHLANNRFTEIPCQVCHLDNLAFLDMSDNLIRSIPEEIYLLADKLSTLILYINELKRLPDCICDLYELTTLWLGKNQLRGLPRRFGDLENLDWGEFPSETNINDNPLVYPPLEVCRKGVAAIKQYFLLQTDEEKSKLAIQA